MDILEDGLKKTRFIKKIFDKYKIIYYNKGEKEKMEEIQIEQIKEIVNEAVGGIGKEEETKEERKSAAELREKLRSDNLSNLEYATVALELRDAVMAEGGGDPFCPASHGRAVTNETMAAAENTAQALKHCVEVANGSNEYFNAELSKIMRDSSPITARR